jgi:hypothetical protein
MSRKHKGNKERIYFTNCEICGQYPAMWRWFNWKVLCSECATKAFMKYLAALASGAAVIWLLCF